MKEFREDKKQLEEEVLKLINEFEKKYNCYVYEIDLLHKGRYVSRGLHANTIQVVIDYKLCD
jgi:hypothetical protein